jgi:hypothetical protein
MDKRKYHDLMLAECSENQRDLHKRMYPNGVSDDLLDWAITQLENTQKINDNERIERSLLKKLKGYFKREG